MGEGLLPSYAAEVPHSAPLQEQTAYHIFGPGTP